LPQIAQPVRTLVPELSVQFPSKRGGWGRRRQAVPTYSPEAVIHVPGLDCFGLDPFWTFHLVNPSILLVAARYTALTPLQLVRLKVGIINPYVSPARFTLDEGRLVATVRIRLRHEKIDLVACRGHITCYVEEDTTGL